MKVIVMYGKIYLSDACALIRNWVSSVVEPKEGAKQSDYVEYGRLFCQVWGATQSFFEVKEQICSK